MGRPLPGSSEVRIARYDIEAGGLVLARDGFAQRAATDEVGMLLARVRSTDPLSVVPLRAVFSPGDAWLVTGDLFRRDGDGDYWRVDGAGDVIRTEDGPAFTTAIRDALTDLPAVDLAVAYGVDAGPDKPQIAVAAVTLRPGQELSARELGRALGTLEPGQRPLIVRVVDELPMTTWYRPITSSLREAGVPAPRPGAQAWYRDASGAIYRPLTQTAYRRLRGPARRGDGKSGAGAAVARRGRGASKRS
jgi:putative long chain acyl-CoA synthase